MQTHLNNLTQVETGKKSLNLAFYGLKLTIFLTKGWACWVYKRGGGGHPNQVAIYLETYFVRKQGKTVFFIYRYII